MTKWRKFSDASTSYKITVISWVALGILSCILLSYTEDDFWGDLGMYILLPCTIFGIISGTIGAKKGYEADENVAWGFWLGIIGIIVVALMGRKDQYDPNAKTETSTVVYSQSNSNEVADEILKLKKLYDEGIISQEDFENRKNKLLNS